MSTKTKVIAVTLVFAVVGFMLNPSSPIGEKVFGAPDPSPTEPTGGQAAALMAVGTLEAIAFGLGIALLFFGLPMVRRVIQPASYAVPVWLTVAWLLSSWVPHTALHRTVGHSIGKLVVIEYLFHVTLVVGGLVLAKALLEGARLRAAGASSSGKRASG